MARRPPFDQEDQIKRSNSLLKKLYGLYSGAHKDIVGFFDEHFFRRADATGIPARGSSTLLRNNRFISLFDRRIEQLNASILRAYDTFKGPYTRSISLQVAQEVIQLGLTDLGVLPTNPDLVQNTFSYSYRRVVSFNRLVRPQLFSALRVAATKANDYKSLRDIVTTEDKLPSGLISPIGVARSHMLANTRYAVVAAANETREETMFRINKEHDLGIRKMWWSKIDTACYSCALLHGQIADLGEEFDWQLLGLIIPPFTGHLSFPPLHVNCYCRIIPVTDEILASTDLGRIEARRTARVRTLANIL